MSSAVAIVGIGCRFPGGVMDAEGFWALLRGGRYVVGEIPPDRMDLERWLDPEKPGKIRARWGGYLDGIDQFDAAFFGISPREAERLDPQQRLLLETAWEALEDAGENGLRLDGSRTGVFVGQWISDFEARLFARPEELDFFMTTGSGRYAASGRLSYVFGFRGPSMTIDTACSSSLVAVHLASQAIRNGECELALAGGVNVILQPQVSLAYSRSGMLAADGKCKFGDAAGDGYVRSEGAGLVVLKPLDLALASGDRIYAVIRGSAVSNDGHSSGSMGTPSPVGQEALLRAAHRDAGIAGGRISYVEAHGTGTRTGDPVELAALGTALAASRAPGHRALIGSVKTNIGHTEGAAGVAGLIKTALALHHREIPASLHFKEPNPAVSWSEAPFAIPDALSPWPASDGPRFAGVSAFGIAGTNAHVVLEEAPPRRAQESPLRRQTALLPLSARSPEALRELALRYADLIGAADAPALGDVCAAAATRRSALEQRAAFVASDSAAMVAALRGYASGAPAAAEGVFSGSDSTKIAFVFPGQGGQWAGMARELLEREPVFRDAIAQCDRVARPMVGWSILELLQAEPAEASQRLNDIDVVQPVLLAMSVAYGALWRSFGVEPAALVGHSMGEVGAAHLAGALDLGQAMRIVCRRSALMKRTAGRGAMALVDLSAADAAERIRGREEQIAVAVSNSPRSSVLSGDPAAVDAVLAELEREGVFCRRVKVDVASHSPQMTPLAAELVGELRDLVVAPTVIPLYSTVLARRVDGSEVGAEHWGRNLRQPVLFGKAVSALLADGITAFVELGPHPVLLPAIEQTAQAAGKAVATVASGRREEPEQAVLFSGLGRLWTAGAPLVWDRISPPGADVVLPHYPWQRERYWVNEAELVRGEGGDGHRPERLDDQARPWLHRLNWEPSKLPEARGTGRWLVASDDPAAGDALGAALRGAGCFADVRPLESLEEALLHPRAAAPEALAVLPGEDADVPYLPVRALQALLSGPAPRPMLWFVTRGAHATGEVARVAVAHAALWGAARVVAEEHPEIWGGLVDLDPAERASDPAQMALVVRQLLAGDGEDGAALRGGERLVQRLRPFLDATSTPFVWRPEAAYLISGGLGDVPLLVARHLVARGVRRLILLGRTALPVREEWPKLDSSTTAGRRVAAVRELEAAGAAVHVAVVDVSNEGELRAFLDRWTAEGWPPIRGVFHAAGAFQNQLASRMDHAAFDEVVRPKLVGGQLLDRLLPELDLFVLFSSIGGFLTQPGQANYAAANAGLDALAVDRRARGRPALSVDWGVWEGIGLVRGQAGEANVAEMSRQGVQPLAPEEAVKVLSWLCGCPAERVAVVAADWTAFGKARAGRMAALFRGLAGGKSSGTPDLAALVAAAAPADRKVLLEPVIREALGQTLKLAPDRIDRQRALGSMGLSSLLAMELRNRLEVALGRALPASLAFNYPTVAALVDHLAGGDAPQPEAGATVAAPAKAAEEIAELSEEQAMLALRSKPRRGRV